MNSDFGADIFDPGAPADPPPPPNDTGDAQRPRKRRARKAKPAAEDTAVPPVDPSTSASRDADAGSADAGQSDAGDPEPREREPTETPNATAAGDTGDEEVRLTSKRKRRSRNKPATDEPERAEKSIDAPAVEADRGEPETRPKRSRRQPRRRARAEENPDADDRDAPTDNSERVQSIEHAPDIDAPSDEEPSTRDAGSELRGDPTPGREAERDGGRARDDERPRRRGRRGRRRRDDDQDDRGPIASEGRDAATRSSDSSSPRPRPSPEAADSTPAKTRPGLPTATPATQRVAVLLDLDRLAKTTTEREIELSYARVLRALVGTRPLLRAVGYGMGDGEPPTGIGSEFEWSACAEPGSIPVAMAVDALNLADRVDCVIFGTDGAELAPVASTLRSRGVRVESAGLEPGAPFDAQHHHVIGRECTFRP